MEEILLNESFEVSAGDFLSAGEASGRIKKILKQLGVQSEVIRRAAIVSYEAELNLVIHSLGGRLELEVTPQFVTISTKDIGPGIEDISLALKEGWSTAPDSVREMGFGAGMGLPNMKKYSDEMKIDSVVGEGTTVTMTVFPGRKEEGR